MGIHLASASGPVWQLQGTELGQKAGFSSLVKSSCSETKGWEERQGRETEETGKWMAREAPGSQPGVFGVGLYIQLYTKAGIPLGIRRH